MTTFRKLPSRRSYSAAAFVVGLICTACDPTVPTDVEIQFDEGEYADCPPCTRAWWGTPEHTKMWDSLYYIKDTSECAALKQSVMDALENAEYYIDETLTTGIGTNGWHDPAHIPDTPDIAIGRYEIDNWDGARIAELLFHEQMHHDRPDLRDRGEDGHWEIMNTADECTSAW